MLDGAAWVWGALLHAACIPSSLHSQGMAALRAAASSRRSPPNQPFVSESGHGQIGALILPFLAGKLEITLGVEGTLPAGRVLRSGAVSDFNRVLFWPALASRAPGRAGADWSVVECAREKCGAALAAVTAPKVKHAHWVNRADAARSTQTPDAYQAVQNALKLPCQAGHPSGLRNDPMEAGSQLELAVGE